MLVFVSVDDSVVSRLKQDQLITNLFIYQGTLKVLTNEKRSELNVVSFGRPPFKLFTLRFSNKSVQARSWRA